MYQKRSLSGFMCFTCLRLLFSTFLENVFDSFVFGHFALDLPNISKLAKPFSIHDRDFSFCWKKLYLF